MLACRQIEMKNRHSNCGIHSFFNVFSRLSLFLCLVCAQGSVEWLKSNMNIFNSTSRHWEVYIGGLIKIIFTRPQEKLPNFTVQMHILYQQSFLSCVKNMKSKYLYRKMLQANFSVKIENRRKMFAGKMGWLTYFVFSRIRHPAVVMRNVFGHFVFNGKLVNGSNCFAKQCINNFQNHPLYTVYSTYYNKYSQCIQFLLHIRLGLNFTFSSLLFIGNSFDYFDSQSHCHMGGVLFQQKTEPPEDTIFCGQQSAFGFHTRHNKFEMNITMHPMLSIEFSAFIQVIDKNTIVSTITEQPMNNTSLKILHTYLINKKAGFIVYEIQGTKIQYIVVETHVESSAVVHMLDGPGYASQILTYVDGKFVTSSFHCILLILSRQFAANRSQIEYWLNPKVLTNIYFNENVHLVLDDRSPICDNRTCLLVLNKSDDTEVNITVGKLSYKGEFSQTCRFAGFTTVHLNPKVYKENNIFVQTPSARQ